MTDEDRPPISWDALAAELAATREEAEQRDGADAATWDAVAAELAARVADRPAAVAEPAPVEEPAPLAPPLAAAVPEPEPEPAPEPQPDLDPAALRGGLEALLFVVDTPVDEETLAAALRCPPEQLRAGLAELARDYDERRAGTTLRRVGEGWRLYTREEHAPVVERYLVDGQKSRLTQAALETLAVIAYRQPVTVPEILEIRGVQSSSAIKTLLDKRLIVAKGRKETVGRPMLYGTSKEFLLQFGLKDLSELPSIEDFEDLAGGGV